MHCAMCHTPQIAREAKRVAVLGIKTEAKRDQPAYYVPEYLQSAGVTIVPVRGGSVALPMAVIPALQPRGGIALPRLGERERRKSSMGGPELTRHAGRVESGAMSSMLQLVSCSLTPILLHPARPLHACASCP